MATMQAPVLSALGARGPNQVSILSELQTVSPFLGPPVNAFTFNPHDRQHYRDNWDLAKLYEGRCEYFANQIDRWLLFTRNPFITQLMPVRFTNAMHFKWRNYEFEQGIWNVQAPGTAPNYTGSKVNDFEVSLKHFAKGVRMDTQSLKLPDGYALFVSHLMSTVRDLTTTMELLGMQAMLAAQGYWAQYLRVKGELLPSVNSINQVEVRDFDYLRKQPRAFYNLIERAKNVMSRENLFPTDVIVRPGMRTRVAHDSAEVEAFRVGTDEARRHVKEGADSISDLGGVRVHVVQDVPIAVFGERVHLMTSRKMIGDHGRSTHREPPAGQPYRSESRDICLFDMTSGQFRPIIIPFALEHCMRFDFSDAGNGFPLLGAHYTLAARPNLRQEAVAIGMTRKSPDVFLYEHRAALGTFGVCKVWGDIELDMLPVKCLHDMAMAAIDHCVRGMPRTAGGAASESIVQFIEQMSRELRATPAAALNAVQTATLVDLIRCLGTLFDSTHRLFAGDQAETIERVVGLLRAGITNVPYAILNVDVLSFEDSAIGERWTDSFKSFVGTAEWFFFILVLMAPINGRQVLMWYNKGIPLPLDMLYERPFKRYDTSGVMFVARDPSGSSGEILYTHADAQVERDAMAKQLRVNFTVYMNAIVRDPKTIYYVPNVLVNEYRGGETLHAFKEPGDFRPSQVSSDQAMPSMLVFLEPCGSLAGDEVPRVHDVRGQFAEDLLTMNLAQHARQQAMTVHHPSALYYRFILHLSRQLNILPMAARDKLPRNAAAALNSITNQTVQLEYNYQTGSHDLARQGACHFGNDYTKWDACYKSGQEFEGQHSSSMIMTN